MTPATAWRPLRRHIALLADAMGDHPPQQMDADSSVLEGSADVEWGRSVGWLRMAAGLQDIRVFRMDEDHPSNWMDKRAAAFAATRNDAVARITTEYTRHLYVWNAVERYLKYAVLPGSEKKSLWTRAVMFLKDTGAAYHLPPKYIELVQILEHYARMHGDHVADDAVRAAFDVSECDWRDESGILLMVSHKLRHTMAHGAVDFINDLSLGMASGDEGFQDILHGLNSTTRGLLLSLQMLLANGDNLVYSGIQESPPFDGWTYWDPALGWSESPTPLPSQLFWSLHLLTADKM